MKTSAGVRAAVGLALAAAATTPALAQNKVVNVYNWAEYTAPDTIPGFERESGIKVRYDIYDNNDTLQAKLLTGKSGYDIVVPSTHYASRQIEGACSRSWTSPNCLISRISTPTSWPWSRR